MNKAQEVVGKLLKQIFKPRERITPAQWVEREIRLSHKTSGTPGRYRLDATPYLRHLFDDLANPRVRKIVVKKGAQLGLTQYASNALLFYVCNLAFPLLMIMPSQEAAQQFCERSLTPSIALCDAIKPFLTGKDDDLKKTEFLFTSSIVRVIGAGSPSKLASNPAAVVVIDECDKLEDFSAQHEAPALQLAEARVISFPYDKKIVILSTPTVETTSVVHSEYLRGSQSKYYVPCPYCHHEQPLSFAQIKWPDTKDGNGNYDYDRVEREAFYECEQCARPIGEQHRLNMVRQGRWVDTNPNPFPAEIRSYQISSIYSPFESFGSIAKQFLLAKGDAGKLRHFYNSVLGECFQQQAATIGTGHIERLVEASPAYSKHELPGKPHAILMAADTQGESFWYAVQAVYDDHCAVIDWGQAQSFDDLELVSKRQYLIQGTDERQGIYKALIDSAGNRTSQVYDFCVRTGYRFVSVVGRSEGQGLFAPIRESTVPHKGYNVPQLKVSDKHFKDVLYLSVIKERASKLYFPRDIDEVLKRQLSAERLVEKKSAGELRLEWICTNRENHLGDCFKYLEAFKYRLEPQLRQLRQQAELQEAPKRQYDLAARATARPPAQMYATGWD